MSLRPDLRELILTVFVAITVWLLLPAMAAQTNSASPSAVSIRSAADFRGASIVERIQAAILDCGASPCEVYVPAGKYQASAVSSWNTRDSSGSRVGIILPSNVDVRGAGAGHTIIEVQRKAGDPPAILFANSLQSAHNIRLHDISLVWNDSATSFNWVSIFICHACQEVELDHLVLEGNANKLVNLLDSTNSSVHDNRFLLRSTTYGHGDNALTFARFDARIQVDGPAGIVRDNTFEEIGDYRVFSMVVVSQSGLYVHSNVFEAHLPPPGYATGIESGQDNVGQLPRNVKISDNIFHGASIAYGGLVSSEISGNFLDHGDIYVSLQSGTTASVALLTIADNELHFGSIGFGGLADTFSGRSIITRNRVFDGGIGVGNRPGVGDMEVSFNTVRDTRGRAGIQCDGCSIIRGNLVREVGQNGPGDRDPGYAIYGPVVDVSDNVYFDEQHQYDTGTVCSIASPSSTQCLSSGRSRWVLLRGAQWGAGWTNRVLFTARGNLNIRAFVDSSLLELDQDVDVLPAGTRYQLYLTTSAAFQFNGATIDRFTNNVAIATNGTFRDAAIEENGKVSIQGVSGNVVRPYKCAGTCTADLRTTATPTD